MEIPSFNIDKQKAFLNIEEVESVLIQSFQLPILRSDLDLLIAIGVLPVYDKNGEKYLLYNDLISVIVFFQTKLHQSPMLLSHWALFEPEKIDIAPHTIFIPSQYDFIKYPAHSAALKNLFGECWSISNSGFSRVEKCIDYLGGSKLITVSKSIAQVAKKQMERACRSEQTTQCIFSKSASYMGTKKILSGFITEAVFSVLPTHGVVIDLMCGSGVMSAAFSDNWRTIASDSQVFCRVLAKIHGKGFNEVKSKQLLNKILPVAKDHFSKLCEFFPDAIIREEKLFYSDTNNDLLMDYADFTASFPRISTGGTWGKWNPSIEVESRKHNTSAVPYCLFTAYFANVFFGLRQCLEIDSLRYAIDQLQNEEDKLWATGALITTTSAVGSTYGGHFAQPFVKDIKDVSLAKLSKIIDKRSISVNHEFSIRLLNLSKQSQHQLYPVDIVKGPWNNTLLSLGDQLGNVPVLVYLDAPYKREEYSRYYHVLETLCLYNYPSCTGVGLIPRPGERFHSEFFTRTTSQLNKIFTKVICQIVERGWICAWSYSSSGSAQIYDIVCEISSKVDCNIKSYAVPAIHKSHGGAKPKSVTEYLIIFSNKKTGICP